MLRTYLALRDRKAWARLVTVRDRRLLDQFGRHREVALEDDWWDGPIEWPPLRD